VERQLPGNAHPTDRLTFKRFAWWRGCHSLQPFLTRNRIAASISPAGAHCLSARCANTRRNAAASSPSESGDFALDFAFDGDRSAGPLIGRLIWLGSVPAVRWYKGIDDFLVCLVVDAQRVGVCKPAPIRAMVTVARISQTRAGIRSYPCLPDRRFVDPTEAIRLCRVEGADAGTAECAIEKTALSNTTPLTGLPLPGLLAGRGGLESAMRAERPAGLRTAAECAPTCKEPAALRVRPSLWQWPVADAHARS
jgi:hypothetical protein